MNERTFVLSEIESEINANVDLYFFGDGVDDRDKFLRDIYTEKFPDKCFVIHYDVDQETFAINAGPEGKLKSDFNVFLRDILVKDMSVFLDVTSIPVPLMFYMLQEIQKHNKLSNVFCAYTKPELYHKNKGVSERDRYELNEGFLGIKPIPGFLRSDKNNRDRLLVVFLGYEGNRARYIYEEESASTIVPVIGLPGFRPGWNDTAFEMNLELIGETSAMDYVEYIAADSPFEAYELLSEIRAQNPAKYLVLAPLGTKPSALGIALFSIISEADCAIIYDNPKEKKNKTVGVTSTLIYDVSSFFC